MAWSSRIVLLLALTGCGDAVPSICDRPSTEQPVAYTDGCTNPADGVYLSAGYHGETSCGNAHGGLLHFPGGRQYRFSHELSCPTLWTNFEVYLSFERDGLTSGSIAPAAGNQAQLTDMDENTITILNASCVEYWMLIRVWCSEPPP